MQWLHERGTLKRLFVTTRNPDLQTLLAFGREQCGVARPELVIQRIEDALSRTLTQNRGCVAECLWRGLEREWGMPASG